MVFINTKNATPYMAFLQTPACQSVFSALDCHENHDKEREEHFLSVNDEKNTRPAVV